MTDASGFYTRQGPRWLRIFRADGSAVAFVDCEPGTWQGTWHYPKTARAAGPIMRNADAERTRAEVTAAGIVLPDAAHGRRAA